MPTTGQYFRWGLKHLDLVEDMGDAAVALASAKSIDERWKIVKPVGDKLAPAADELFGNNGVEALSESDANELRSELLAALQCRPRGLAVKALARDGRWLERAFRFAEILLPILLARGVDGEAIEGESSPSAA